LRIRVRIDRLSEARGIAPLRMSMTIQRQESRANLWSYTRNTWQKQVQQTL